MDRNLVGVAILKLGDGKVVIVVGDGNCIPIGRERIKVEHLHPDNQPRQKVQRTSNTQISTHVPILNIKCQYLRDCRDVFTQDTSIQDLLKSFEKTFPGLAVTVSNVRPDFNMSPSPITGIRFPRRPTN